MPSTAASKQLMPCPLAGAGLLTMAVLLKANFATAIVLHAWCGISCACDGAMLVDAAQACLLCMCMCVDGLHTNL